MGYLPSVLELTRNINNYKIKNSKLDNRNVQLIQTLILEEYFDDDITAPSDPYQRNKPVRKNPNIRNTL